MKYERIKGLEDKKSKEVLCTHFTNGKRHDVRLFKESGVKIHPAIKTLTDTGYQGIRSVHFITWN